MASPRTLWISVRYAVRGLWDGWRTQRNLRVHLIVGFLACGLGVWLRLEPVEWGLLSLTIVLVLVAELLNTAVEVLVDLVSPERRTEAMRIKDLAAAAVLVCAGGSLALGGLVFVPHILSMFF